MLERRRARRGSGELTPCELTLIDEIRLTNSGFFSISIDAKKADPSEARRSLDCFAGEMVEDDAADGYAIRLRDGKTTMKPSEVSVRKQIKLEAAAHSLDVKEAWDAMKPYFLELSETGRLEV